MNNKNIHNAAAFAFILLFTYTALMKFHDYTRFHVQIGETPWLFPLRKVLALAIPASELIIAFALAWPQTRLAAMKAALALMILFTTYIVIVLAGNNKPCSCGGVLEALSWTEHLFFNLLFILIAAVGIWISKIRSAPDN